MPVVDPHATCLQMTEDWTVRQVPIDNEFWATIGERTELHHGCLVTGHETTRDFGHWEMHPEGDELIVAISGAYTLIVEGVEVTPIAAGEIAVVPKGRWHRLTVRESGRTLFFTPGKGTQHRPLVG